LTFLMQLTHIFKWFTVSPFWQTKLIFIDLCGCHRRTLLLFGISMYSHRGNRLPTWPLWTHK